MTTVPPASPPRKRRRSRKWLLLALLLVGVLAAVFFGYPPLRDEWRLSAAIAEADRRDPGWRWEELQARRRVVPDAENSALRVLKAANLMPNTWSDGEFQKWEFHDYTYESPTAQFDDVRIAVFRRELAKVGAALAEARG